MVLGMTYGQLLLILGASVALFGPREIQIIARQAGRLSGRAVGFIKSSKTGFEDIVQRAQADQVHKELQETLAQLEAIRHEIRSGFSIMNPGPLTRQHSEDTPNGGYSNSNLEKPDTGINNAAGNVPQQPIRMDTMYVKENKELDFKDLPKKTGIDYVLNARKEAHEHENKLHDVSVHQGQLHDINVLPISAVMTGRITPKKDGTSGVDCMEEAIEERRVAVEALNFFAANDPQKHR